MCETYEGMEHDVKSLYRVDPMVLRHKPQLSKETARGLIILANWEKIQNRTMQHRIRYLGIHFPVVIVIYHY